MNKVKTLTTSSETASYHQLPFHLRGSRKGRNEWKSEMEQNNEMVKRTH